MKSKKMVLLVATLCFVMAMPVMSHAYWNATGCTVSEAGAYTINSQTDTPLSKLGGVFTTATDLLTCFFAVGREKEMLAVALTAMANGKKVDIYIDTVLTDGRYTVMNMSIK